MNNEDDLLDGLEEIERIHAQSEANKPQVLLYDNGPWEYVSPPGRDPLVIKKIFDEKGKVKNWKTICTFNLLSSTTSLCWDGNGKLIAAAPDLLEACQKAMNVIQLWGPNIFWLDNVEQHQGENKALQHMKEAFESAIKKATA